LGLQILYDVLNRRPEVAAERAYAPWPDLEALLRARGLPLVSLESHLPLADFHVLGFSLQYELTYTNLLTMLELGRVPLRAAARAGARPRREARARRPRPLRAAREPGRAERRRGTRPRERRGDARLRQGLPLLPGGLHLPSAARAQPRASRRADVRAHATHRLRGGLAPFALDRRLQRCEPALEGADGPPHSRARGGLAPLDPRRRALAAYPGADPPRAEDGLHARARGRHAAPA